MGDFEEKLEHILNDPQAMSQIMSLAQSLGASAPAQAAPPPPAQPQSSPLSTADPGLQLDPKLMNGIFSLLSQYNSNDDQRVALLNALRPFVKEQRYAKLDKAIQIAKLSRMARMALELFRSKEDDHV